MFSVSKMTEDMGYAYDELGFPNNRGSIPVSSSGVADVGFRLHAFFSSFTDLFSKFGRYIAPAYHHDRCERSVQMRLYSMNKQEFALVFLVFFGLYACAVVIGIAGPPITATKHRSARHDLKLEANDSAAERAIGLVPSYIEEASHEGLGDGAKVLLIATHAVALWLDPFFFLVLATDSILATAADSFFQASFLCALLFFWLSAYHGLRQTNRTFRGFYLCKALVILPVWVCSVSLSIWERANQLSDPTFSEDVNSSAYYGLKIFFFVMGALYILMLVHHIVKTYSDLRSMPYFDMRLKFLTVLMLVVLSVSIAVVVLRFGVGVLEDHFVSQLSTTYRNSAEFMSFYGLLNLYLYTMAFVYSPAETPQHQTGLVKDNPSFSMVTESDEDIIFGSDDDVRRPLYDFSHDAELTD
ncbi:unnamed protein product [Notodromas monacha]|uniref:Wntless-like transmembrane domain-containing protein n=1 Tax=Notodromas monacha TaxID=399045 RepID=A0A7R9G8I2_9CRUS|nr:unnamed protein product [Notodromas monacha]CAG0913304.1 unnamed protein product [Notodromas monacha]